MQQDEPEKSLPLGHAAEPDRSSWPAKLYIAALIWAFATLVLMPQLDGAENNAARLRAEMALLGCATLRLAWALHKKEKNKGWIFYITLLFLAVPIWTAIEPPLWKLGRMVWGKGLSP